MKNYLLIGVFFLLGLCVSDTVVGQERQRDADRVEQQRRVVEHLRQMREAQERQQHQRGDRPEERDHRYRPNPEFHRPVGPTHRRYGYYRDVHPSMGVGYRPYIIWLPEGAQMGVGAYANPYTRRVMIGGHFGFSGISGVNTFNFRTGEYR